MEETKTCVSGFVGTTGVLAVLSTMAENFFSILKTEYIYRHKPMTFSETNDLIDIYIHFYNYERIRNKAGVAPLTLRHSA